MSVDGDLQVKGTYVPRSFGRSLLIVRPLRAESSCAIHRAVERPVKASPQVLHRPACPAREDCGRPGALALVLAAALSSLPPLPQRGLALETQAGVQLQTMAGQPLATLAGMDLAFDQAVAHKLVVRDRQGRLVVLGGRRLRATTFGRGCRTTDVALVVCARTVRPDDQGRAAARPTDAAPRAVPDVGRLVGPRSHSSRPDPRPRVRTPVQAELARAL